MGEARGSADWAATWAPAAHLPIAAHGPGSEQSGPCRAHGNVRPQAAGLERLVVWRRSGKAAIGQAIGADAEAREAQASIAAVLRERGIGGRRPIAVALTRQQIQCA